MQTPPPQPPQYPQFPQQPQWGPFYGRGNRPYFKGGKFLVGLVIGGVMGYLAGQNKALKKERKEKHCHKHPHADRVKYGEAPMRPVDFNGKDRSANELDVKPIRTEEPTTTTKDK